MFTDPDVTEYIHYKSMTGDHFTVATILKQDPQKVHCLNGRLSVPPLFYACRYGHTRVCQILIDGGADIHYSRQGWTPLHEACCGNHLDVVRLLLSGRVNPNVIVSWSGMTPLMHAVRRNFKGVCELLIHAKANVWQRNIDGNTALDLAGNSDNFCQHLLVTEMKRKLLRQAWKLRYPSNDCVIKNMVNILSNELMEEVITFL